MNFQPGFDYPIAIWQVSNPNFSPTIWMNFQTGSDYPIAIWQMSNPNFPNRLDEFPDWVWLSNYDLTNVKFQFPWPFGRISKPGLITQLRFD